MESIYTRTEMMLGENAVKRLKTSHVAVFGVGGVGGFVAEALARAGVGKITLIEAGIHAVLISLGLITKHHGYDNCG